MPQILQLDWLHLYTYIWTNKILLTLYTPFGNGEGRGSSVCPSFDVRPQPPQPPAFPQTDFVTPGGLPVFGFLPFFFSPRENSQGGCHNSHNHHYHYHNHTTELAAPNCGYLIHFSTVPYKWGGYLHLPIALDVMVVLFLIFLCIFGTLLVPGRFIFGHVVFWFLLQYSWALKSPSTQNHGRSDKAATYCLKRAYQWYLIGLWGPFFCADMEIQSLNFIFVMASLFHHQLEPIPLRL
jgi:hypothetical protein